MNKADLVNLVAARTELTKTDVSLVVDAAIDTIIDSVVEGKKVSILGFGSFEPRDRSARQGLNPKTGQKIKVPPGIGDMREEDVAALLPPEGRVTKD